MSQARTFIPPHRPRERLSDATIESPSHENSPVEISEERWPTPDYLSPSLLPAIALARGWAFVLDWGPFLLLVLSWQTTAGIADQLGQPLHVEQPAEVDFRLFGGRRALPAVLYPS